MHRGTSWVRWLALWAGLSAALIAYAHEGGAPAPLDFTPPAPGTYQLHRIMRAPDGRVLDVNGHARQLSHFIANRITLLGFIYTTCTDPEGCPLAYRVFDSLRQEIETTPALHDKVQFVTLSFDPARDTPAVMQSYAGSRIRELRGLRWYFLTTGSARQLMPLVEGFGQDVRVATDKANGRPRRELSHVLKVFLIDKAGNVREIYTSTFLHPRMVMNDITTLLMEEGATLR